MEDRGINKTVRWTLYTTGVILAILGTLTLLGTFRFEKAMGYFMGVGFLFSGLNNLVPHFSLRKEAVRPRWLLPSGVIDIVLSIIFLTRLGPKLIPLPILIGAYLLLSGSVRLWSCFAGEGKRVPASIARGVLGILFAVALFSARNAPAALAGLLLLLESSASFAEGRLVYPSGPKKRNNAVL